MNIDGIATLYVLSCKRKKNKSPKAHPLGHSFLSAAVRIGSLALRMAAFSCAWV